MDMPQFLICSSVGGCLGCCYFWATMNNAARKLCASFCTDICFYLCWIRYVGVELLGHMVTLWLTFEELPDCFPKWPHHSTSLPAVYEGSNFYTASSMLIFFCSFGSGHLDGCEVLLHHGLDLGFPNDS